MFNMSQIWSALTKKKRTQQNLNTMFGCKRNSEERNSEERNKREER
jgi:hypothetical protein